MEAALPQPRRTARRIAYGLVAAGLLAAVVFEMSRHGANWWLVVVFGLGPDIALVAGAGSGLAHGQLHPRAVPLYNALHRFWGPAVVLGAAGAGLIPAAYVVGGLVWGLHIAVDRALGYGLRTRDGFQRA